MCNDIRDRAIKVIEEGGYKAYILPDDDPEPPREVRGNLGRIAHWHGQEDIGGSEERTTPPEFLKRVKREGLIYLPIAIYQHSGTTIWVGDDQHPSDPGGWDSGQVGFIYATPQAVRENFMVKRITKKVRELALELLEAEVRTIDMYYRGDVYGYEIQGPDGEIVDNCWGFYGDEHVESKVRQILASYQQPAAVT